MSYLKTLQTLLPSIGAAGGKVLIVTAEPAAHLPATRAAANYVGEAVVDPSHKLATLLREKGLLDVAVTKKAGYEFGMAQPAVLVLKGKGSEEVLEKWAIVPSAVCVGFISSSPSFSCWARGRMVEGTVWLMVHLSDEPGRRKGSAGLESDLGQCASEAGGQAARAFEVRLDFLCRNGLGENLRLRIVFPPSLVYFSLFFSAIGCGSRRAPAAQMYKIYQRHCALVTTPDPPNRSSNHPLTRPYQESTSHCLIVQ